MEKKRLKEIAEVRSGYPFRNRIKPEPSSDCSVIQMKDLRVSGSLQGDDLLRIESPSNYEGHVLLQGDVLLAARGQNNRAMAVMALPGKTIPASNLFVITPDEFVSPEYLAAVLNLPETQSHLRSMQAGSSIPFLPITALSELSIPIPSFDDQLRIAEIHRLRVREEDLLEKIKKLRGTLIDASLRQILNRPNSLPARSPESETP